MKKEALKLADELEKPVSVPNQPDMIYIDGHRMYGAQLIRRLVERIDSQDKHLQGKDDLISRLVEELDKQKEKAKWFEESNKMFKETRDSLAMAVMLDQTSHDTTNKAIKW